MSVADPTLPMSAEAPVSGAFSGEPLLIVGASARAAAQSARRGGFLPYAVDLFGDTDLVAACQKVIRIENFPAGIVEACRELPDMPWMYVGGLENHPELVDRICEERPLLGNSGDVLRTVRDPMRLAAALQKHGLPFASAVLIDEQSVRQGRWLLKPRRGSGGRGIHFYQSGKAGPPTDGYLQEFVEGESQSGVFVAASGKAELIGVSWQLVGEEWLNAPAFAYCGSVGPMPLTPHEARGWQSLGDCLAKEFSLRGLFGIDAIVRDGRITPVEVNPRYTASVEVLEGSQLSAIEWHLAAIRFGDLALMCAARSGGPFTGKAILYSHRDCRVTEEFLRFIQRLSDSDLSFADIPAIAEPLLHGAPIVSILARGGSPDEADARMRQAANRLKEILRQQTEHERG